MSAMPSHAWVFPASVERVIDGDTLNLYIDAGLKMYSAQRVRLLGVDTPEMRGPERVQGQAAKAWVEGWLAAVDAAQEWPFVVSTLKDPDNFGRYLVVLWRVSDGRCLNDDLLAEGYAVPYEEG